MTKNPTTRREFLKATSLGGASAALSATLSSCSEPGDGGAETQAGADKPNIVLIMSDDLGYECLGCYGGTSYKTPRLDELAATGLRFNHAYAQPLCTPTRLQLMTGEYNFRNWKAFGILDPSEKTFGHMMQAAGYKTCISGKWQLYSYNPPDFEPEWRGKGMHGEDAGFDEYCLWHAEHTEDKGSRYADPVVLENGKYRDDTKGKYGPDVYTDYINGFMERHRDRPFFVYYPMALTHGPFNPTPHSTVWETGDRLENDPKYFGDMVEYMDFTIGRIVDKIDELGLRERTLIIFYSDNGSPRQVESMMGGRLVKGGKGKPTDAGTHVPLIANWKGTTQPGVTDDLIDSTDFLPTMAEMSGAAPPAGITVDGRSFLSQLRGKKGNPRDWVLVHHDPRPGWGKKDYTKLDRFARDQRYKLYDDGRFYDIPNDIFEESPVGPGKASSEAEQARQKLQKVLDTLVSV